MSRDSSHTYVHTHASHHADLFEEFCHPPSSSSPYNTSNPSNGNNHNTNTNNNGTNATSGPGAGGPTTSDPTMIQIPGHFLPFEEIQLPAHLMPVNPEDEDGVVPDMHAAFGIQRAMGRDGTAGAGGEVSGEGSGRGVQQEPVWRDLGLERLLDGDRRRGGGLDAAGGDAGGSTTVARREGRRTGILLMR